MTPSATTTTPKKNGAPPGPNESQARSQLDLIDDDLLDDEVTEAVLTRAKALDRSQQVQARRAAAHDALSAARASFDTPPERLRDLAADAAAWDQAVAVCTVSELAPDLVQRVAQRAVASVPVLAGTEGPRRPAYLTEREQFGALTPQYVARAGVLPPVITAGEVEAVKSYEGAVATVATWRVNADQVRASIRPGAGDVLNWLGAVTSCRHQIGDVRAAIEAADAVTAAADAERARLGLNWTPPAPQ